MSEPITIPTFYEYAKQQGIDIGRLTEAQKDDLRHTYNRHRNRLYKKRQRENNRELTLFLNKNEHRELKAAAKKHNLILSHYIKQASLAYSQGTYITPDAQTLSEIIKDLSQIKISIEKLATRKKSFLSKDDDYTKVMSIVDVMQSGILNRVTKPVNVEQWLFREINENPVFKRKLFTILLSHV